MANFRENLRLSEFVDLFILSCSSITLVCSKNQEEKCVTYAKFMANFREDLRLSEFRIVYSLWSVQRTERNSVHMANFIENLRLSEFVDLFILSCSSITPVCPKNQEE